MTQYDKATTILGDDISDVADLFESSTLSRLEGKFRRHHQKTPTKHYDATPSTTATPATKPYSTV